MYECTQLSNFIYISIFGLSLEVLSHVLMMHMDIQKLKICSVDCEFKVWFMFSADIAAP